MTAPAVDALEVDLVLVGIHERAARTGMTALEVLRDRRVNHVVGLVNSDPAVVAEHRHALAVLIAAEVRLLTEQS